MQVRSSVFALLLLGLAACSTEPKAPKYHPPGEHGLGWRILHPFARSEPAPAPSAAATAFQPAPKHGLGWRVLHPFAKNDSASTARLKGIQVTVEPDSAAPSLHGTSQLGLRILVTNYTSTMVSLTFPTSQRIEITGRNIDGKIFYSYSTNRTFAQEVSVLTINPGERLEYNEAVPTRTMTAGNTYLITAAVKGQPGLEGTVSVTPVP
ncbi:MAG: BsuPI-related putative proteinase inhibitor [Chthoniobacterales bacterium]